MSDDTKERVMATAHNALVSADEAQQILDVCNIDGAPARLCVRVSP